MGDGKLTVFEYADLDDGDLRLATPLDHARLRQRAASLERELAEARTRIEELLEDLGAEADDGAEPGLEPPTAQIVDLFEALKKALEKKP